MTTPRIPTMAVAVVLFIVTACGGDSLGEPPSVTIDVPGVGTVTVPVDTGVAPTVPTMPEVFEPTIPLPAGFPVYPGATLGGDVPYDTANYLYLFSSDAPREEVCEFYMAAFEAAGFEVSEAYEGTELGSCNPREIVVEGAIDGETVIGVVSTEGDEGFIVSINHGLLQGGWPGA